MHAMKEKTTKFDQTIGDILHIQAQHVPIPQDVDPWMRLTQRLTQEDAEMTAYLAGRDSGWLKDQDLADDHARRVQKKPKR